MAELAGLNPRQLRGSRAPWSDPVKRDKFLVQLSNGIIAELYRKGVGDNAIAFITQNLAAIPTTDYLRFETMIALAEHPDQRLPHSRAIAARIDSISDCLMPTYQAIGWNGTRALIVDQPDVLAPLALPEVEAEAPLSVKALIDCLTKASEESEVRDVITRLSLVSLFATFARLDVETMQHWDAIEPRSLFALLLPQSPDGRTRHPMSRLIDFMACCAFGGRDDVAAGHVPTLAEIKTPILDELGGNEDRLNAWRNGRSFLTLVQAVRVWEGLHHHVDREPPMPPVAMIVAASVFQSCLIAYDEKRRAVKTVLCVEDLYGSWWRYYSNQVDWSLGPAKPMAWPACFERI